MHWARPALRPPTGPRHDPFGPSFMDGQVFGAQFPSLNIRDFFEESHPFFPSHQGINMQDFGVNFLSNFRRTNLIDLA